MGEVGFSFVGVAFLLALFIPTILWAANQSGDAKDACVKQAKADESKGKADIKAMKKM